MFSKFLKPGFATTLYAGLAAMFVIVLIWARFGTTMLGVIEEWQLPDKFIEDGISFFTFPGSRFPNLALRPFNILPQAVAHLLTPESFQGWHALQMLSLAGKAMAMAYLVWWLTRQRLVAVFAGLLLMVYPADTMQISLRALHINWAVAISLGSVALLLASTEMRASRGRAAIAALAALLFVSGSFMYEAGLFLAPLPLLLWWVRFGVLRGVKPLLAQKLPIALWIVGCAVAAGYLIIVGHGHNIYQSSISADPSSTLSTIIDRLPALASPGLYRTLLEAWYEAYRMVIADPAIWVLWLGVAVLFAFGLALRPAPAGDGKPAAWGLVPRLLIAGGAAAALGYMPYLASEYHLIISQRTFLYAAPGGALVFAALVLLLARWQPPLAVAVAFGLVCLGVTQQETQMTHYVDLSLKQRMLLAGGVEALSGVGTDKPVLIIDNSGYLSNTWMLRGEIYELALGYVRHRHTRIYICEPPGMVWASFNVQDVYGAYGTCEETADSWVLGRAIKHEVTLAKAGLVRLDIDPDGVVTRVDQPPPPVSEQDARRAASILRCWPAAACLFHPSPEARWYYDFGTWWSLEKAQWGSGWADEQWDPPAWLRNPVSYQWTRASTARLWFMLAPVGDDYRLRFNLRNVGWPEARKQMTVRINGARIELSYVDDVYSGDIPQGVIKPGRNSLEFSAPLDPEWSVGIAPNWVDVSPSPGG